MFGPSDAESKRHARTDWSFIAWCRHCTQGRRNNPPRSGVGQPRPRNVPATMFDYSYLNNDEGGMTLTALAITGGIGAQHGTRRPVRGARA